jgi:translation initiation factor 1
MMTKKKIFTGGLVYSTEPAVLQEIHQPEAITLPAAEQRLKVSLDSKQRAGKLVTLVTGFVGTTADLETLGKLLKTSCGTGGSAKEGQIIIQGDYKQKVFQLLQKLHYQVKS